MPSQSNISEQVRVCADRLSESGAAALGGLYDLTAPRLVRLATTITRNQHDAEDAVQAVLVRVAGQPQLLSAADQPWPYLLRMVRNEALVVLRRRKRRFSLLAAFGGLTDLLTPPQSDPLVEEDVQRAIWLALRKLPTEQSEVVVLKIWEELTFAEIADMLQLSTSTVASRYRYGLAKLSRSLGDTAEEIVHG